MFLLMPFGYHKEVVFQGSFEWCRLPSRKWWSRSFGLQWFFVSESVCWCHFRLHDEDMTMSSATLDCSVFCDSRDAVAVCVEEKEQSGNGPAITPVETEVPTFWHLFKRFAFWRGGNYLCLLGSILVLLFQLVDSFSIVQCVNRPDTSRRVASIKILKGFTIEGNHLFSGNGGAGQFSSKLYTLMLSRDAYLQEKCLRVELIHLFLNGLMTFSIWICYDGMIAILPWLLRHSLGRCRGSQYCLSIFT